MTAPRVVIVDDSLDVLSVIADVLRQIGPHGLGRGTAMPSTLGLSPGSWVTAYADAAEQ